MAKDYSKQRDGDITFFDLDGNVVASYESPSFDGMTETEILNSGAFGDPVKAKKLLDRLRKRLGEEIQK